MAEDGRYCPYDEHVLLTETANFVWHLVSRGIFQRTDGGQVCGFDWAALLPFLHGRDDATECIELISEAEQGLLQARNKQGSAA